MPYMRVSNSGGVAAPPLLRRDDLNSPIFKFTLETAPNGIVLTNSKGEICFANSRVLKMFDYETEELLGQPVEILVPERFRKNHPRFRFDYLMNPKVRPLGAVQDLYAAKKNGEEVQVEIGLNPIFTEGETFVLATIVDITQRKKVEFDLIAKTEALERALKELDGFAYSVSHDLKAPLRGISQVADWLYHDHYDKATPEEKENLLLMKRRVTRMNDLIQGILRYCRIGRTEEDLEPVNLRELIKEVVDTLNPPFYININMNCGFPILKTSRVQMEQIFSNLVSNAIRFTDKKEGKIEIGCKDEETEWIFYVKDNGVGIDKEHHNRIFEVFQTLAPQDEVESTGIGLSIVKKIVEINRGKVWVESKVGEGSTFYFNIPKS